MARQIVAGIDIGTSLIKVIIAEELIEHGHVVPRIIGTGSCESRGVCRGYITDPKEAAKSVETAVARASKTAGVKVRRAYISFDGVGLASVTASGAVIISRADLEIAERDLTLALEAAEAAIPPAAVINRRIINIVPIEYKIDGKMVLGQALGLKAQKLEVKALFITCLEHLLADLINTVEEAGVEVADVVAAPVAASFVTLSKKQKRVGCLLADIGAETLSVVVFENGNLISLEVFPIGANDITNDIALGLKVSLEDAENVKLDIDRRIMYSKKKLEDIISARLKDSFELIDKHLRAIGRDGLLPGGSIITGGSAAATGVKSVAEHILELPPQLSDIHFGAGENKIKDRTWAVALGLVIVGFNSDDEQSSLGIRTPVDLKENSERVIKTLKRWFSQFLP